MIGSASQRANQIYIFDAFFKVTLMQKDQFGIDILNLIDQRK